MASSWPLPPVLKTYSLVYVSSWSTRRREIRLDSQPIYTVKTETRFLRSPRVFLSSSSTTTTAGGTTGSVLGMVKLSSWASEVRFQLGPHNSGGDDDAALCKVTREGWTSKTHLFAAAGREFRWTRTRDAALGASRWVGNDFKLVDVASGQVVMTHINRQSLLGKQLADLNFYVELGGDEVEVAALLVMLGIQLAACNSASVADGGGGGGGGC